MNTTKDTIERRSISDDRDMIIQVLAREQQCRPLYGFAPDFTVTVGDFRLLRDGRIVYAKAGSDADPLPIFEKLAYLGLCEDDPASETDRDPGDPALSCRLTHDEGQVLLNLFCILSARQRLLNQALAAKNRSAFLVAPALMDRLLAHPPRTLPQALRMLYGHEAEYAGLRIDRAFCSDALSTAADDGSVFGRAASFPGSTSLWTLHLTGFEKCPGEDAAIHRQLADRIFARARDLHWTKPYTRNVRNRKYAFHTWLYAIGMAGEEYEAARNTMLARLYGKAGSKRLDR